MMGGCTGAGQGRLATLHEQPRGRQWLRFGIPNSLIGSSWTGAGMWGAGQMSSVFGVE
jgi:hypothetical protein